MVDCWDTAICRAATPCHRAGSSVGASIINGGGEYVSLAEIFLRKLLRFCLSRLAIGSQNRTASGENSRCNKKAHPAFRQDARKIACGHFQANGINLVHFAPKSPVFCNFISYLRHKISRWASSSGRKRHLGYWVTKVVFIVLPQMICCPILFDTPFLYCPIRAI